MTKRKTGGGGGDNVALYHVVYPYEDFEEAARALFAIVKKAAQQLPGAPRVLYLDVEGHRNDEGGLDADAFELVSHFLFQMLMPYLTEAHTPLGAYRNPAQSDDIPEELQITGGSR
jgi:hypothetical protein